ncbi:MAG: archaellin/type IV pilin N-terminal domain-containing protein [Ignisphaera sp.]
MSKLSKGIEPIIAVVILVAVTIVIAIGVIGWIMGWWGVAAGSTEMLQVTPLTLNTSDTGCTLIVQVYNKGSATATITQATLLAGTTQHTLTPAPGDCVNGGKATVNPGQSCTIKFASSSCSGLVAGLTYQARIYTAAGNVYPIAVQATSS